MTHEARFRDYLNRDEVAALLRAAKKSPRHGARNHAMILLAYRHGLRASELVNLRVSDLDLANGTIYCRRAKNSADDTNCSSTGQSRQTKRTTCDSVPTLIAVSPTC
jgi:type 1 fimbriae regulatory protein FimB